MSLSAAPVKPCGCGCGGSGCGGSGTAAVNLAATAFARPRFFAGQLLTEDDLGALTAYVTAKNRLHNRYLFGAGVVCGLWVSCDPCGGGAVTVQPGYALDCCGNDLVLACPAPLDVNAMIRDLRAAQLGKDCGDPCADQGSTTDQGIKTTNPSAPRHYRLYARYGEQETDPVAPYATEEPCGQVACEPSRVREGVSFVLKCPPEHTPPPDDLWCRLQACLPSREIVCRVTRLDLYSRRMVAATGAAERRPVFRPEDADQLTKHRTELAEARKEAGQVRSATEQVRKLAAALARYELAEERAEYADMSAAHAELRDAAAALAGEDATAAHDPIDRPAVDALLGQAARLADPSTPLSDLELAMLAQGRPLNEPVLGRLISDAAAVQEWLLARLDSDPALADCELRSLVQAVPVTAATKQEASTLRSVGRTGSQLVELFARIVTDCVCAALNPPCAPCEDTDVLLACLEVADCEVVRICNACRDYVISGSALRYWLPTGLLHQAVEAWCCPAERRRPAKAETFELAFDDTGLGICESLPRVPWELLGLPDPGILLHEAAQRFCAGRATAADSQPATAVTQPSPGAPAGGGADATVQQVSALAQRVAELTEQVTNTEAKLGQTQADLSQAQASLTALASGSPAGPSPAPASPAPASPAPASPAPASRGRRGSGARRPAKSGQPAATPVPPESPESPEAGHGT
jgi:hypothetical protein